MQLSSTASARLALALLALTGSATLAGPASAQTLTTVRVASGLTRPLYLVSPPGDTHRQFIVEQEGKIKIRKDGVLLGTAFLDVGASGLNKITALGNEQGLLGLAFHPNFASNRFFYIAYTNVSGNPVVERYQADLTNPDLADAAPGTIMLGPISHPQDNHNGGCLQFGPDGMLYISSGDGGNSNDTGTGHVAGGNAQSGGTLLGKMLRIDVDLPAPHIPADNPFVNDANVLDEIWDLGLRNPWRFCFDSLLGNMWIGDVGQGAREEVDYEPAGLGGRNYGWRCMEGFSCTALTGCTCNAASLTLPILNYSHAGGRCSITGGFVYRGCAIPGLGGTYFYADYCAGTIWSVTYDGSTLSPIVNRTLELAPGGGLAISNPSSFGQDADGELYICDIADGEVYKIISASETDCNLNGRADVCDISEGGSNDFNLNGVPDECECGPAPFTYCTPKVNSLLCTPTMSFSGTPSASASVPFLLEASQVVNQKSGLLFYGYAAAATPFQGGFQCALAPLKRTPVQDSGGTVGSNDCTGQYSFEFNARIASGIDPALVVGQQVNAQYWGRDPGSLSTTSLTDAVQFVICF